MGEGRARLRPADARMTVETPQTHLPGDVIDERYRINEIKRGAMGIVYLCVDTETSAPVAVKTFQDRFLDSEESRARFLEESLLWIQLGKHPNIVQAYGLRIIGGKPHLLAERVIPGNPRGASLKDAMFANPADLRMILRTIVHVCNGMIHAGRKFPDFVHGDLKPENILLDAAGVAKITDFGLTTRWRQLRGAAGPAGGANPDVLASKMEGTPAFSSPEQCELRPLDRRSDIYSFGCVMYQLATRRLPFLKGTVAEHIHAHRSEAPRPPEELNGDIPPALSGLILKCMEKNPGDRFEDFAVIRDIAAILHLDLFAETPPSFENELEPSYGELVHRAWSYALLGRFPEAEAEFGRAGRVYPDRKEIHIQWGKYFHARQLHKEAMRHLEEAILHAADNPELYELLGKTYRDRKRYDDAQYCFRTSIRLGPSRMNSYLELADLYLLGGKKSLVEDVLLRGLDECEYPVPIVRKLASFYEESGLLRERRGLFRKASSRHPRDTGLMMDLAEACLAAGDRRGTLETLRRIEQSRPDSNEIWARAGALYYKINNWPKAADAWDNALADGGDDPDLWIDYAKVCHRLRRHEEAWDCILHAEMLGANVDELKREIQTKRFLGRLR